MSGIDRFRWVYEGENEWDLIIMTCPKCLSYYELEMQDLVEIAKDGIVLCDCGCNIYVRDMLEAYNG